MNNQSNSNNYVNPNAKEAMKQFKMETARDFDVFPPQKTTIHIIRKYSFT